MRLRKIERLEFLVRWKSCFVLVRGFVLGMFVKKNTNMWLAHKSKLRIAGGADTNIESCILQDGP